MSIFKKITILFVLSFILMSIIGLWIDNINSKRIDDLIKDKYKKVANELLENIDNEQQVNHILKKYHLKKYQLNRKQDILYKQNHTFGFISVGKELFEDEFIIQVKYLDDHLVLRSEDEQNINDKMILNTLIFLDIALLILIFLYILKLLSPLKTISSKINAFSNGNLSSRIDINSNDEIGMLSKSFNQMASRLEKLITTREELLRDIGHELRTPIAKGKFAIEKIDDFSQKELLRKTFLDLEILTNDLIELEKLNSNNLTMSKFTVETLIVESLEKIHCDDESTIQMDIIENFTINADLYYLGIAVKNLIDNALKYSDKYPIIISSDNNSLSISSYGKKLSKDFKYYLEPFTQELSQRDGFGLGLSIVNKIITKHKFNLEYKYMGGMNIFIIKMHP